VNTGGTETNIDWDDLRIFLAVYRAGSVAAAGRALGITHVTVGRRLAALEEVTGCLFERLASGYELTSIGRDLLPGAEAMDTGMQTVQRALVAEAPTRAIVRFAIPSAFIGPVLEGLTLLRETAPEIVVELLTGTQLVSLKRREADIALRMWRFGHVPGEGDTLSKRVGRLQWSVHAHPALLERLDLTPPLTSLEGIPWVGFGNRAPFVPGDDWLRSMPGEPRTVLLSSSLPAVLSAIERELGVGAVPDLLGAERGLVRISEPVESMAVWLALHPAAKADPHVVRLRDHMEQVVARWPDDAPDAELAGA
jgi:DNA-binding transcriptional LysR family regulator